LRYRVHRFEFLLDPGFQVDDSKVVQLAGSSRGSRVNVAVRLLDLVVRRNRAMFSTNVRLDAVFITGDSSAEGNRMVARTWTFPRVGDGDRLAAEELVLYAGPVQDFLDMALWVSRANQDNPNLPELIGMSLQEQAPQAAGSKLLSAVAGADRFVVTAGISTIGTVVESVGRVLRHAVNRSIGLYRTTLLAPDGFAAGRRPASGLRETQDMAFAYDVVIRD
jgi:hypothetical protein